MGQALPVGIAMGVRADGECLVARELMRSTTVPAHSGVRSDLGTRAGTKGGMRIGQKPS